MRINLQSKQKQSELYIFFITILLRHGSIIAKTCWIRQTVILKIALKTCYRPLLKAQTLPKQRLICILIDHVFQDFSWDWKILWIFPSLEMRSNNPRPFHLLFSGIFIFCSIDISKFPQIQQFWKRLARILNHSTQFFLNF